MISEVERSRVLTKMVEIEKELAGAGEKWGGLEEMHRLRASNDSIAPVLRTALVINWKEQAMRVRYERFRCKYPEISSLARLKELIERTDPVAFCKNYLDINATSDKNPKYVLLKTLTWGFLDYQIAGNFSSEIDALRDWAENVDKHGLTQDPIGKCKGVGAGVVENIRLNLGCSVIKPDRHVIGVLKNVMDVKISCENFNELARSIGMEPRKMDWLLFRYGQKKQISV